MSSSLTELLDTIDNNSGLNNAVSISGEAFQVLKIDNSFEVKAETYAFSLRNEFITHPNPWGTYYGPYFYYIDEEKVKRENPKIDEITEDFFFYWEERSEQTTNPWARARYLDLIWDLKKLCTGIAPEYQLAVKLVHSLIQVCNDHMCEYETEHIRLITRAYQISCSLNNEDLIQKSIITAIDLEPDSTKDESLGLWGFCFDLFVLENGRGCREDQKLKIISDIEQRMSRLAENKMPWKCQSASIRLAKYYRKSGLSADVERVLDVLNNCFVACYEGCTAIEQSTALRHMHKIFTCFNQHSKAEEVAREIAKVGPSISREMQVIEHSEEISNEDMQGYVNAMLQGSLEDVLRRIAVHFLQSKSKTAAQVQELSSQYPLHYMFRSVLQDNNGRPIAEIGSVKDDFESHVVRQMSMEMTFNSLFLFNVIRSSRIEKGLTSSILYDYIVKSPLFAHEVHEILKIGIEAYFDDKYVESILVLLPHIEAAVRRLIDLVGGDTLKPNRDKGMNLRTLDDLLRDKVVVKSFGEDMAFYLRVLLTEQIGWNIRNRACHGLLPFTNYNYYFGDRVIHALLCLAQVKEKSK